jgi:hypothetical protein
MGEMLTIFFFFFFFLYPFYPLERWGVLTIFWLENMKRPLLRRRCRWEDNIRMDLRETEWEGVDWMHLS